jgi:hypothetical protein
MRRNLILAVSVLALTAVSQPLFAAETEMAAPQERAAPARRAPPPAARPAPLRQAVAQPQATQTSSFTGAQAGGFGGGNVGGGGFADPICLNDFGGLNNGCSPVSFNHSLNKTGGFGGGVIQYMFPVSPWIMVGVMGDIAGGKTTASSTQSFFRPSDPSAPSFVTSETYTNSVSQSTNGSIRFKAGLVTLLPGWYTTIMPYVTVGWIRQKFEGTFSYSATNFDSFCPSCGSTIANSALSWSHQANGVVFGFGVDVPIPAFGPGVVLVFDYSHASFQSFDITAPVAISSTFGAACIPGPGFVCATTDNLHVSNPRSDRFTFGVRVKFL